MNVTGFSIKDPPFEENFQQSDCYSYKGLCPVSVRWDSEKCLVNLICIWKISHEREYVHILKKIPVWIYGILISLYPLTFQQHKSALVMDTLEFLSYAVNKTGTYNNPSMFTPNSNGCDMSEQHRNFGRKFLNAIKEVSRFQDS